MNHEKKSLNTTNEIINQYNFLGMQSGNMQYVC